MACTHYHYHARLVAFGLDTEIEQADYYLQLRDNHIDSLRLVLAHRHDSNQRALALYDIAEQYAPYRCDSAISYYTRACECASDSATLSRCRSGYDECMERSLGRESVYSHDSVSRTKDSHGDAIRCYNHYAECHARGDSIEALEWLTRSAIADVRSGVTDNASSWMLAQALYNSGDTERAKHYIEYSGHNADIFRARLRYMQVSPLIQLISTGYQAQMQTTSRRLAIALCVCALALIMLIAMLFITLKQYRRVHRLNDELVSTNTELDRLNHSLSDMKRIREEYICSYLEEKSAEIRRIHRDSRRAGALDSDEKYKKQLDAFYHNFDATFLRLYPHFVEDVNHLLTYEARITPPKGELTPELRIFALIRLGITRSTQIARLLCYSNNTIYNYRSRLKNNARGDREMFEDAIQHIG